MITLSLVTGFKNYAKSLGRGQTRSWDVSQKLRESDGPHSVREKCCTVAFTIVEGSKTSQKWACLSRHIK